MRAMEDERVAASSTAKVPSTMVRIVRVGSLACCRVSGEAAAWMTYDVPIGNSTRSRTLPATSAMSPREARWGAVSSKRRGVRARSCSEVLNPWWSLRCATVSAIQVPRKPVPPVTKSPALLSGSSVVRWPARARSRSAEWRVVIGPAPWRGRARPPGSCPLGPRPPCGDPVRRRRRGDRRRTAWRCARRTSRSRRRRPRGR